MTEMTQKDYQILASIIRTCRLNNQQLATLLMILDEKIEALKKLKRNGPIAKKYIGYNNAIYERVDTSKVEIDAEIKAIKNLHFILFGFQRNYGEPKNVNDPDDTLKTMLERAKFEYIHGARESFE